MAEDKPKKQFYFQNTVLNINAKVHTASQPVEVLQRKLTDEKHFEFQNSTEMWSYKMTNLCRRK